jgi:hypothetical protein
MTLHSRHADILLYVEFLSSITPHFYWAHHVTTESFREWAFANFISGLSTHAFHLLPTVLLEHQLNRLLPRITASIK